MSIASEITRLQNAKSALKTAINAKTDSQHQIDDETLDDYAGFVDSITGGDGSSMALYNVQQVINGNTCELWITDTGNNDSLLIGEINDGTYTSLYMVEE